jgi:hypothetical protein
VSHGGKNAAFSENGKSETVQPASPGDSPATFLVRHDDLEIIHGRLKGDRYLRRSVHRAGDIAMKGPVDYEIRSDEELGQRPGLVRRLRRVLVGEPIGSEPERAERLGVVTGLPVFASDNISSSAYATEEIMRILVLAGAGALAITLPITLAIILVLAIVVISYQQTIAAYPSGGGSYIVAKDNLDAPAALTAAGALVVDYVLTVAVSIAAGVAALTSLFPELHPHRVVIGSAFIGLIALGNLRGIRESGAIFAAPASVYLIALLRSLAISG